MKVCGTGATQLVKILLESEPKEGVQDLLKHNPLTGKTPLFVASANGHAGVVSLLLGMSLLLGNADDDMVNRPTHDGVTPMYVASANRHTEVVALLLAHTGIDVNQKTNEGRSPLCVASGNGDAEVVALLLSHPNINVNA